MGKTITVEAIYIDLHGTSERVSSSPSPAVAQQAKVLTVTTSHWKALSGSQPKALADVSLTLGTQTLKSSGTGQAVFEVGADAQARQLARSKVKTVVAVSCDAGTFARDAEILVGGGYALKKVTAVDQFKWSSHVEVVALFTR